MHQLISHTSIYLAPFFHSFSPVLVIRIPQFEVADEFAKYDCLVVGTPTWNTGEISTLSINYINLLLHRKISVLYLVLKKYMRADVYYLNLYYFIGADTERSGTGWDEIYYSEMQVRFIHYSY